MAGATVAKQVIVEMRAIDAGVTAHIQQVTDAARKGKREVDTHTGALDRMGTRSAVALRQISSATETIARQGKVSGEAAKQLIAQGANAALFFGPQGALVGAIGIATLAMVGMFGRVKREIEETERRTLEMMNRFAEMDAQGQARAINRLVNGPRFKGTLGTSEEDLSVESLIASRGLEELEKDRARLAAQVAAGNARFRAGMGAGATTEQREAVAALEVQRTQLKAVEAALAEGNKTLEEQLKLLGETGAESARTALAIAGQTAETRAATEAERERAQALKDLNTEALAVARDFERTVLQTMGSATEQVAAPFDALIARARKLVEAGKDVDANLKRISALEQLRDQAVSATEEIAEVSALLTSLDLAAADGVKPTADTFMRLTAAAASLKAELATLVPGSKLYLEVQQKLLEVERERSKLLKGTADAGAGKKPEGARTTADMAREIQQATDGALQLAMAFGAVDDELGNVLRSIGQIAGNLPSLLSFIGDKAPGTNVLGIVGAALPILGALGSLIGDSPEEQQRRKVLEQNTDAIKELTKKAGDLGLDVSGTEATAAAAALDRFLADDNVRFATSGAGGGMDARAIARAFGLDMKEMDRIAKEHGITLDGSIESFRALQRAIDETITTLGEFNTDLDSQKAQAEATIDIMGITDPVQQEAIRRQATAGRSPALDAITAGLDMSTPEGRAEARRRAQATFGIMQAGGDELTAAQLGGLSGDELLQAILDLIDGLNAIDEAQGTNQSTVGDVDRVITADRTQITADQASRMLGVQTSQLTELRIIRAALTASQTPLTLPSLPPGFASITPMGGGGTTINITQNVEIMGGVSDVPTLARGLAHDLVDEIDRALGRKARIRRAHLGAGTREA